MPKFLTVKEAALAIGKSPSAVRRIIYPIVQAERHEDRKQIEPSVEDAMNLRVRGENFAWRISEEYLRRVVPMNETPKREDAKDTPSISETSASIIAMLQRELDIKNQQIATQNELMKGLSERLHEGNVLIGSLQQQLALTDGRSHEETTVVDAASTRTTEKANKPSVKSAKPEKGSTITPKPSKLKRGFLSRLFH